MFPAYYIFNVLLSTLLILHVIWTYYILKILCQALLSGRVSQLQTCLVLAQVLARVRVFPSPGKLQTVDDKNHRLVIFRIISLSWATYRVNLLTTSSLADSLMLAMLLLVVDFQRLNGLLSLTSNVQQQKEIRRATLAAIAPTLTGRL